MHERFHIVLEDNSPSHEPKVKTKTAYNPDYTWLSMDTRPVIWHGDVVTIL